MQKQVKHLSYTFNFKTEMDKFIKVLIRFILFLFVGYTLFLSIWGLFLPATFTPNLLYKKSTTGLLGQRIENLNNYRDVDILFLGSSITYRGFDTELFKKHGLKTFNLGSSAQTPMQTNVLLKRYYEQLNPKLVIYEIYPPAFSWDGVESSIDLISYDRNDIYSIKMGLETMNVSVINTLLFSFIIRMIGEDYFITNMEYDDFDTYVEGGFVKRKKQFNSKQVHALNNIKANDKNLQAFRSNINIINDSEAKLLLLWLPNTTSYYNSILNTHHFDSLFSRYGDYLNFNTLLSAKINDSLHFYDPYHLNINGTTLVNDTLIKIIEHQYNFD